MKTRFVLSMTVLSLTMAFAPTGASAASNSFCRQLENRLHSVAAPSRPAADARLSRALHMARVDGCDGGYVVGRNSHCRAHANRIRQLRDMAGSAVAARDQRATRARIKAALRANECYAPRNSQPVERVARVVRVDPSANPVRDVAGNIPVPSPRPLSPAEAYRAEYVAYGKSLDAAAALRIYAQLAEPRDLTPGQRDIRVVGGKFLPEPNEDMEFQRIAMGRSNPANDVVASVLRWVESGFVTSAVAEEIEVAEAQ